MPIDPDALVGATLPETEHSWTHDDVILYHLGIGAGVPPTEPNELAYTYEDGLKVLPTFGTIPMFRSMMNVLTLDGLDVNPAMVLHGGQRIEVGGPIPTAATVVNRGRVAGVWDTGTGAVVDVVVDTVDESGSVLFTNAAGIFVRGEGGFGGDSPPPAEDSPPDREPDLVMESPTLPQQALLYRLSGDKNPLHADPAFAAYGGFDRPILHGLCTYGIACKAVVDRALGGDEASVASWSVRFRGVVFPGETIVTRAWQADGRWIVESVTAERGEPVLTNASVVVAS